MCKARVRHLQMSALGLFTLNSIWGLSGRGVPPFHFYTPLRIKEVFMSEIVYDYAVYVHWKVGTPNYRAWDKYHKRYRTCHGKYELSVTLAEILRNPDIMDCFYYVCQPIDREPTLFDWSPDPNEFTLDDFEDSFFD